MTFEINPPAPEKAPVGLGHPSKSLSPRMNGSSETPKAENGSPKAVEGVEGELRAIRNSILEVNYNQVHLTQGLAKVCGLGARLDSLERRQEDVIKMLMGLRSELAGVSSGMARRDSMMLGSPALTGLSALRRDSLFTDPTGRRDSLFTDPSGRRDSLVLSGEGFLGRSGSIPVMEVDPWEPPQEVREVLERLLERQFLLSPWVREKRLRNQLRLILKDHLEAGPMRRSTVTKIVHDAHQVFPVWRNQIREVMFDNWGTVQEATLEEASDLIFDQFKKPRFPDEIENCLLYTEHMIEVGQYLRKKAGERAEKQGKMVPSTAGITNSKFWYEVRKKINEIVEANRSKRNSLEPLEDDSDIETDHSHTTATPQSSVELEESDAEKARRRRANLEMEVIANVENKLTSLV